jgi:hypothetical protein
MGNQATSTLEGRAHLSLMQINKKGACIRGAIRSSSRGEAVAS